MKDICENKLNIILYTLLLNINAINKLFIYLIKYEK